MKHSIEVPWAAVVWRPFRPASHAHLADPQIGRLIIGRVSEPYSDSAWVGEIMGVSAVEDRRS